ncbi:hypothetical protein MAR_009777 [Mya arenaria]|uniref:Uncharacterized protein n=1 Tax=Mya arenaria TaxID=6604 RepID=A0ABY7E1Y0_MYAAR|nr:hypothetical protein MAR_009777 [Mya arenaria]
MVATMTTSFRRPGPSPYIRSSTAVVTSIMSAPRRASRWWCSVRNCNVTLNEAFTASRLKLGDTQRIWSALTRRSSSGSVDSRQQFPVPMQTPVPESQWHPVNGMPDHLFIALQDERLRWQNDRRDAIPMETELMTIHVNIPLGGWGLLAVGVWLAAVLVLVPVPRQQRGHGQGQLPWASQQLRLPRLTVQV